MTECKYYSFYALAKINDPESLYEAFQQQIAPGHSDKIGIQIYERADDHWRRLTPSGGFDLNIQPLVLSTLADKFDSEKADSWYFEAQIETWFCSYKPLTSKHFVLSITADSSDMLIEEGYLQFLFHFYCHQLQMLQGTYRDALTGLYNRRAFNEKIANLLENADHPKRRAVNFIPSIYVMADIDHFKEINDNLGHLFGDEVLLILAQLMTESFRENDLLFRYGGEEFAMVLMDITPDQAMHSLQRFREKVASHKFPSLTQVTISVGFTEFDKKLSMHQLVDQADNALYHCKATTRNAVHHYQELVKRGLLPIAKRSDLENDEVHYP